MPAVQIIDRLCVHHACNCRNRGPLPAVPQELTLLQQQDDNAEAHSVDVIPLLQACFQAQPKAHSMVYLSGMVHPADSFPAQLSKPVGHYLRPHSAIDAEYAMSYPTAAAVAPGESNSLFPLLPMCTACPRWLVSAGPVGFHSSARQADTGWGCGYRNIQMQLSHLLNKNGAHQQALFGGCKFVPDIGKTAMIS